MSTLYKPTYTTYRLPDGRYRTLDGKRVTSTTPGAEKVESESPFWWGRYTDADGNEHQAKLSKSKETARRMLAKLAGDAQLGSVGLDPHRKERRGRLLADYLADWEAELKTGRGGKRRRPPSTKHVQLTVSRVRKLLTGCGFTAPSDLSGTDVLTRVQKFLDGLTVAVRAPAEGVPEELTSKDLALLLGVKPCAITAAIQRHRLAATGNGKARRYPRETALALLAIRQRGLGAGTAGYYAREMKAFTRWLVGQNVLDRDPLVRMPGAGPTTDHRRDRRALAASELRSLLAAAEASPRSFRGLAGSDRHLLYATAAASGFRAEELSSLVPESFDLDEQTPTVVLSGDVAKNGRTAVQPLPLDLATRLKTYLAGKPSRSPVWPGTWWQRAADMLRIDLDACGIPYAVEGPEGPLYADFHSLRHAYVALLDSAGISLKMAMQLARHSDPKLTMARYGRAQLHDLAAAVKELPSLFAAPAAGSVQGACKAPESKDGSADAKAG